MPKTRSPNHVVRSLSDRAGDAWFRRHGNGHVEVPLSVVAALAILAPPREARPHLVNHLTTSHGEEIDRVMRYQWRRLVTARPDLTPAIAPLALVWHGQTPMAEQARHGAHEVTRTVARAGLFDLTGDPALRRAVDLFGVLLSDLKGHKTQAARGAFYTSAEVSDVIAHLTDPTAPGSVHDPALGTGGLWRATAVALRRNVSSQLGHGVVLFKLLFAGQERAARRHRARWAR